MRTLTLSLALLVAGPLAAQQPAAAAAAKPTPWITVEAYPLDTCVVSGKALDGDSVKTFQVEGRTFKTCCGKCQAKVEKDPAEFVAKLDAAIVAAEKSSYPLTACPISGKALDSMGGPLELVLDGHLVQLCCKGCVKKATAKSGEIVAKIQHAAYEAQKKAYPLKTCVVSDEALDGGTDVMYGTRLVRLCCEDCVDGFEKNPKAHLAKIDEARGNKAPAAGEGKAHGEHGKEHGKEHGEHKKVDKTSDQDGSCCESGEAASGCCEQSPKPAAGKTAGR